jgi:hypothetical protein
MTRSRLPDLDGAMFAAADRYRDHFDEAPPVWQFGHRPAALARELLAAVARGEALTAADLYRRLGIEPPPNDAEL